MDLKRLEENQCFNGVQYVYEHHSEAIQGIMRFGIYLPFIAQEKKIPVLYWLSGLTCSEQNFITKAGAQRTASELGVAIITPDTSPRGVLSQEDNHNEYFGEGASFYVDATESPWSQHFLMYSYITEELPSVISEHFPINDRAQAIFGHSMGGHGALMIGARNPERFKSLSAMAPITAASQSPWGKAAFKGYLGEDARYWKQYDACDVLKQYGWPHGNILVDQGTDDPFLETQLQPQLLEDACKMANVPLRLRRQEGFGHNYYFVASFIEDHIRFHATNLKSWI